MRQFIGEALADDAAQEVISAGGVVHSKSDAVAVAEVELCELAVEMLLAAMLVDAPHAALEEPLSRRESGGLKVRKPLSLS